MRRFGAVSCPINRAACRGHSQAHNRQLSAVRRWKGWFTLVHLADMGHYHHYT
jgi:hypothetical protein